MHSNYHSKLETFNQEMDKHILLSCIPCVVKLNDILPYIQNKISTCITVPIQSSNQFPLTIYQYE